MAGVVDHGGDQQRQDSDRAEEVCSSALPSMGVKEQERQTAGATNSPREGEEKLTSLFLRQALVPFTRAL